MEIRQGQPIVCAYDHIAKGNVAAKNRILGTGPGPGFRKGNEESMFEVKYSGFTPEAQVAFQYAVNIWSSIIKTNVKITIYANWAFLDNINTLAFVTPTEIRNFSESPQPNVWYPIALAEKLAGRDLNPVNQADIIATFNSRREDWYFGTDGNCPPDKFDLVTVVLHELGHGLGFSGTFRVSSALGYFGLSDGRPKIYDTYLQNGLGQYLTTFQSGTLALANQITSNSVTFNSPVARALASSVANPRIFAPNPYEPGSSISHVDESTYENTADALMTPYAERGKVTHTAGPLTRGMLYQMGWLNTVIHHTPFNDQETLAGKKFRIKIESDTTIQNSSVAFHYSYDGFQAENQIIMTPEVDGWFEAEIPAPQPENTVSYFFDVLDIFNRKFRLPLREPEYFSFYLGTDTQKPVVLHSPVTEIIQFQQSLPIAAEVSDNIGIERVVFRYRINEGVVQEENMINDGGSVYSYLLNLAPLALQPGSKIEYQIEATDSSSQNNTTVFPATGWVTVTIKTFQVLERYSNNFNTPSNDFFGDFTIATPTGFTNGAIHSPHPYPKGSAGASVDLTYLLLNPIKVATENAGIFFDEVVLVEPGTANDYNDPLFGDYVIVEASSDLNNWVALTPGYDSRKHPNWLNYYNSNLQIGDSKAVGTLNYYKPNSLSLLEKFNPNDTVYIRFRLYSDSQNAGWGWAIDNLSIQEEVTSLPDEKPLAGVFPNPFGQNLRLNRIGTGPLQVILNSITGKEVFRTTMVAEEALLDTGNLMPGAYILLIRSGSKESRQILIKNQ